MKRKHSIRRDRKGISSPIIAIYIALLTVTLLSAIFIGVEISSSSIISAARTQQDRNQEAIVIHGPNGMHLVGSGGSIIGSLRVNNTGSIALKIRALYIGQQLICDPSTFQDTNIAPKASKWISLISGTYNYVMLDDPTLQADWTVVTERGVKSTEKGEYILFGRPGDNNSPIRHGFKTGPLLILFDFFNWRTSTSIWESGWSIAKGTDNVSWRIYLMNIDTRAITFSPNSFFDLVANTNTQGQDQKWFLDTTSNQQMTVAPGKGVFVHFTTKVNGQPQEVSLNPGVSCLNFLVIAGEFSDSSDFGQTIPFEAVLITDNPSMILSANPQTISVGSGQSIITATMIDDSGNPIPNQLIAFTTNLGLLSVPIAATDNSGVATVKLTAGTTAGTATITASAMGITRSTTVAIASGG